MTTTSEELRAKLEAGIQELEQDIKRMRAALVALDHSNGNSPTRRARSNPKPKPTYEVVPAGKLVTILKDSNGLSTRELAKQTKGDPAQLLELLKELEADGKIHRTGVRAATRWFAGKS